MGGEVTGFFVGPVIAKFFVTGVAIRGTYRQP
jgi:hypothetical protein